LTPSLTATPSITPIPIVYSLSANTPADACNAVPGCTNVNLTFSGTATLCLCTSITINSSSQACFDTEVIDNGTFWLSDGIDSREFTRDGTNFTATPTAQFNCVSCGNA
jgi:hypothetical protein